MAKALNNSGNIGHPGGCEMDLRQLLDRPLRDVVVTYVVTTWGGLEILVTGCELAGISVLVPRMVSLVILLGLAVVLVVRIVVRRTRAGTSAKSWSAMTRNLVGLATFLALLPMAFAGSERGVTWIMWQDAPALAITFGVLAVVTFVGAGVSKRRDTAGDSESG